MKLRNPAPAKPSHDAPDAIRGDDAAIPAHDHGRSLDPGGLRWPEKRRHVPPAEVVDGGAVLLDPKPVLERQAHVFRPDGALAHPGTGVLGQAILPDGPRREIDGVLVTGCR